METEYYLYWFSAKENVIYSETASKFRGIFKTYSSKEIGTNVFAVKIAQDKVNILNSELKKIKKEKPEYSIIELYHAS